MEQNQKLISSNSPTAQSAALWRVFILTSNTSALERYASTVSLCKLKESKWKVGHGAARANHKWPSLNKQERKRKHFMALFMLNS